MTENPFADNLASSSSNNSDQVPLLDDPFSDHYQVADGGSAASEDGLEACSGCKLGGHSSLLRRGTTSRAYIMVGQRIAPDEEDRAEVEVLQARLEKTIQLTKKIKTSQTRLETSGSSVKEAIGPIYGNTQRLQVLGANIDHVNDAIDQLRQPLDIRAQEERIIRSGAHFSGLPQYLASLARISQALSRLTTSKLRSNQTAISDLHSLLSYGNRQLEDIFQNLLADEPSQVEPLHYITKQIPFPVLSSAKLSSLAQVHTAVAGATAKDPAWDGHTTPTMRRYADIRGRYLVLTLQNLAAASINTAKKRTANAVYRRGTSGIGAYSMAMEGLFLAEYENVRSIFSPADWGLVYTTTCRGALIEFSKTLRELNAHVKDNLATDCFLAYEVIGVVSTLSSKLDERIGELKGAFTEALKPVRETAKSSFAELLDDTRRRIMHMQTLPMDGSTVPVTVEAMARLQNMTDFVQPLSALLVSLGDGNWSTSAASNAGSASSANPNSFDVGADGHRLLASYCLDTIETLLQNLDSKSRGLYKVKSAMGAFLANNVAVVDRAVHTSDLGSLLSSGLARLDTWRKKGTSLYLDGWKEPSSYLLDVQYTNRGSQRPPSGGSSTVNSAEIIKALGNKDKDAIKDKFRSFNTSFDEMVNRHKSFTMEREVRSLLAREVQAMIEPLYGRFWDRYHEIDKGKGKYVKYDKGQLTTTLAGLG